MSASAQLNMKGLVAALMFVFGSTVSAATILSNGTAPGDNFTNASGSNTGQAVGASGWYYNNVRNSGAVGINTDYARSGNGSANLTTTLGPAGASSKADIEYLANAVQVSGNWFANGSLGLFTSLASMSYDWYRNSSSTNSAVQHPAMRVLLDLDGNLATTSDRGGLVYEKAYNGGGNAATDTWVSESVGASSKLWNFGLGLGFEFDIDSDGTPYDTLTEWQASARMANAVILGFSVGVGSGWGPFDGATDNVAWSIGTQSMSSNFEVPASQVPAPGSLALFALMALGIAATRRTHRREV